MGKAKEISITYQNNRVVYAPGDIVHGAVSLELKRPRRVKKIKVNAVGESIVKLKTTDGKQLRNAEKYFHYTFDVYTGGDSELDSGKHTFPFQVSLKPALPTSFEGSLGHVRYSIHANLEYAGMFGGRAKAVSAFTVLDAVDLNTAPSARTPLQVHCEKQASGMLWWRKNAVTVDLTTEKSGYVPGEFVYMNGLIVNGRTKPIMNMRIELWQQTTFHGRVKNSSPQSEVLKHDVSSAVASWTLGNDPISAESAANWERKQLFQIPPVVPSGLRHCRVINIQYYFKVTVIIPGSIASSLIDAKTNYITIGTVPLMSPDQQQRVHREPQPVMASAPIMEEMPPEFAAELNAPPPYDPGNSGFSKVMLPSYQEAITGGASLNAVDNEDAMSVVSTDTQPDGQFVPQYAFFDFSQTQTGGGVVQPSAPPIGL